MNWIKTKVENVCLPTPEKHFSRDSKRHFDIISVDIDHNDKTVYDSGKSPAIKKNFDEGFTGIEVRHKDILIQKQTPRLNFVAMAPESIDGGFIATKQPWDFCVLRADPRIVDPRFLFYRARASEFVNYMISRTINPADPQLTQKVLMSAPIPVPALSEQRRIIEILDQADELRKLRYSADTRAKLILPFLFENIFGNPSENPHNWEMKPLGDRELITISSGETPSKGNPAYWNGTIPWVSVNDIDLPVIEDTQNYLSDIALKDYSIKTVPKDAVLILARPRYWVPIAIAGRDIALSRDIIALVSNNNTRLHPIYLYGLLLFDNWLLNNCAEFPSGNYGFGIGKIDIEKLKKIQIMLPPSELQQNFVTKFRSVPKLYNNIKLCSKKIEMLFNTLLYYSFNGELTASWRESRMNELLKEMEYQSTLLNTRREHERSEL